MKHLGVRGDIDGYRVIIDCDTELDRTRVRAIVGDALERIATTSPRIGRRMRREVHQLLVMPEKTPAAAYFHPGTIFIPLQFFDDSDSDYVAGAIVHEATHARLETQGVRYWPHLRARIERRCFREELEFFASLPGREDLVRRCEHLVATWPVTAVKADS